MYQIEPMGVAIPKTQDDLQSAVEIAVKYKVPVLPQRDDVPQGYGWLRRVSNFYIIE